MGVRQNRFVAMTGLAALLSTIVTGTGWASAAEPGRWSSDYDNQAPGDDVLKDFWQTEQEPSPGRLSVVPAASVPGSGPARPAGNALRVELRPYESSPGAADGDITNTGGYLANRAEVYGRHARPGSTPASQWPDPVGSERWYRFSVLVPEDFAASSTSPWLTLVQWKGYRGGSPPVALEVHKNRFRLAGRSGSNDLGGLNRGAWNQFDVGMRLSPDASVGWIEVYRDGDLVLSLIHI